MMSICRGGAQNLGKPELEKVMQRRRPDAEGNLGPIRADRVHKAKSAAGGELEKQLARRTQLLDEVSQQYNELYGGTCDKVSSEIRATILQYTSIKHA